MQPVVGTGDVWGWEWMLHPSLGWDHLCGAQPWGPRWAWLRGVLGCPPSPLGSGHRSARVPVPLRDSSALPQVAAVCEVLGFGQQPAALGRQSRRSQGGDGGGSQQSGDLQGTQGSRGNRFLLGWGDLGIPGTAENLQPPLLPRSSPFSFPGAHGKPPCGWSHAQRQPGGSPDPLPITTGRCWGLPGAPSATLKRQQLHQSCRMWVMVASQAGHPRFLCPHPPYPTRAREYPLPRGAVPAGAGELSIE